MGLVLAPDGLGGMSVSSTVSMEQATKSARDEDEAHELLRSISQLWANAARQGSVRGGESATAGRGDHSESARRVKQPRRSAAMIAEGPGFATHLERVSGADREVGWRTARHGVVERHHGQEERLAQATPFRSAGWPDGVDEVRVVKIDLVGLLCGPFTADSRTVGPRRSFLVPMYPGRWTL